MRTLSKLTGVVALLVLCACASDRGGTTTGTTGDTTGGTTSGTMGGTTGGTTTGTDTGTTGTTGTSGTTGTTGTTGSGASAQVDCSLVRCAACPTGQHPILRPPDCCRCVPD